MFRYRTTRRPILRAPPREEGGVAATATVEEIEVPTDHWVGGERIGSTSTFEDRSPIDEAVIAEVARGGEREADLAVRAAREAFPVWAATPRQDRARILHSIGEGIEERTRELAVVETRDNGSLLRSMQRSLIPRAGYNFRFFADELLSLREEDFETRGHLNRV